MTDATTSSSSPALRLCGGFLSQAVGSDVSSLVLAPVDLFASSPPDDIAETMTDIAANEWQLRASILGEMVTAGGIIALGVMLYTVLRRRGPNVTGAAAGWYRGQPMPRCRW